MEASRMGARASFSLIAIATLSCASRGLTGAPPACPVFNSEAITDYVRILETEDGGCMGSVNAFHDWMESQMSYCKGIDAYREAMK